MFVTFEGPDGAGKTTQIKLVYDSLVANGYKVIKTREPGGTKAAEAIRALLLNPDIPLLPETEVKLHFAARHEHIETLIKPALTAGTIVLCDRFYDSTMAYQHYGLNVSKAFICDEIDKLDLHPDLTIMLTVPFEVGVERRLARDGGKAADRYEEWSDDRAKRVYEGFAQIALDNPDRVIVVPNTGPVGHMTAWIVMKILTQCQFAPVSAPVSAPVTP
jgi:dTMP kinase